ncbi:isoflavone reductase [Stagonosporopsis vannaccii]|nr:isoflavone reductase [Stagonosporopsis vannaccii]
MNTQPTRILLLGAGELGFAVYTSISSLPNTHITLAVRSPQNYTHLSSPSTTLLPLDLSSPSPELAEIFSAYPIILSCTGFASLPGSVTKLALEILSAGSLRQQRGQGKLWFFPWQWGVDYDITGDGNGLMPLFGEQKAVRELLREKARENGVCWTVVSTGIFMSFLFEPFWGIVDRGREKEGVLTVRCLRDWEHGVTVTDVGDIGRVTRRILAGDVAAEDRVVYVAGDSVRYGQLADIVSRVTGFEIVREAWSVEHLQEELRKDPEDGLKKYRLVFSGNGVFWEKGKTVNHQLGMEMMDVKTYVEKLFNRQK